MTGRFGKFFGDRIAKLRKNYFFANKIYLLFILMFVSVESFFLGFISFAGYIFIYLINVLKAKLPIEVKGDFNKKVLTYKIIDDIDLKLDLWYPIEEKPSYPLVLFAHGGGWISGARNQPKNISWCKFLARSGFIVASIDYRLGYKNSMKDILSDYEDSLEFLKNKALELRIDKSKILLMGLSAGGHLSLLYAAYFTQKRDAYKMEGIKGVVSYYAPADLLDIFSDEAPSIFARVATITTLKENPKNKDTYLRYSPLMRIGKRMVPVLIVHGKQDNVVPFSSSVKLASKLKEYNLKYKMFVHPKGGHGFEVVLRDIRTVNILKSTVKWMKSITSS